MTIGQRNTLGQFHFERLGAERVTFERSGDQQREVICFELVPGDVHRDP